MTKPPKEPKKRKASASTASTAGSQAKQKKSSTVVSTPTKEKFTLTNLFGDEEDAITIAEAKVNPLKSVLWRRVAGGLVKRSEDLEGNLFVELRVYNKEDIINVDARQRYWKAAVNLRYQVNDSEPELETLYKFIHSAKAKFINEGTFCIENSSK